MGFMSMRSTLESRIEDKLMARLIDMGVLFIRNWDKSCWGIGWERETERESEGVLWSCVSLSFDAFCSRFAKVVRFAN